jgi:hypothetical protein
MVTPVLLAHTRHVGHVRRYGHGYAHVVSAYISAYTHVSTTAEERLES